MSKIQIMKMEIITKYGEDSEQAKFAQYIFSRRDTKYFVELYEKLMEK